MAEQTHNGTVMTTNLSTLSEKCLKGGHRCEGVCAPTHVQWRRRIACVRAASRLKGQRTCENEPAQGGIAAGYPLNSHSPTLSCCT